MNQRPIATGQFVTYGSDRLPTRDEIANLLGSAARPSLIATDRELSVLRRGLTKEGWKRNLYLQDAPGGEISLCGAGLLSRANQWLTRSIRIPAPGGRHHDFFCEDGAHLELPPMGAAARVGYRCPACGSTYSGRKYDSAHRWFQHRALSAGCLALALVYQIDRDAEYAGKAAKILTRYAAAYPGAHKDATTGGMMRESIDEAAWIIPLAQAYDLVYHFKGLLNGDRREIEDRLFRPAAQGLAVVGGKGSQMAWHASALGVVGCALKDASLVSLALSTFEAQICDELGDDGLWRESVHAHHFSVLGAYTHLAEACCRIGIDLYNFDPKPRKCLKSMFLAPIDYAYPSFQLPAIHDGDCLSALPLGLYEVAYRRWGDPTFAWVLKTGYQFAHRSVNKMQATHRDLFARSSLYAFLFGRDLPGRVQEPRLASTIFPGPGICVLRGDAQSMVTFDYGPFLDGGQLDKMGITVYANDRPLAADYGAPGYGSAIFHYYTSTAAHNTVLVDRKQQSRTSESNLSAFQPGNYLQMAEADSRQAFPDVRHTRRVILAGDIVLVIDCLESESEHLYDWLFRCEGRLADIPEEREGAEPTSSYFTDAAALGRGTNFTLRWHEDDGGLAAWLAMDREGMLISAQCPAETAARTVPVANMRTTAASACFFALLAPYRGAAPILQRCGKLFKVTRGETVDWIYVADAPGEQPGVPEMETDAAVAAVREKEGEIVACGLYEGSRVALRGEPILVGGGRFGRIEARLDSRSPVVEFDDAAGGHLRLKCRSRAMRVNGHRISAACSDGTATIRIVGVLAGER